MAVMDKVQFPAANQAVANRKNEAAEIQLRQAVAGYKPQQGTTPGAAAGQAAAGLATQQGQANLQAQAQTAQMAQTAQQQEMARQQQERGAGLFTREQALKQSADNLSQRIFDLGQEAADEELASRRKFMEYQGEQKYLNERNYADYALANARSEEEYKDYAQASQQAHEKEMILMEQSYAAVIRDLQNKYTAARQDEKQEIQLEITQMKRAADEAAARRKRRAAKRGAQWAAGGQVLGTLGGAAAAAAVVGTGGAAVPIIAASAMAGGQAGGGLGAFGSTL